MIKNILIILTAISAMACSKREKVDLIVSNVKIYSVDSAFTVHSSMAISNGKIIAIGEKENIEKKYESTSTFDATGKYIYPGFIDPHCHFLGYGLGLPNAWLAGAKDWEEVVNRLVENQKIGRASCRERV